MNLPPLREELLVIAGPRAHDGQPGWTLQDPARDRFFRLDWLTFEILQRWSLGDAETIARHVGEQTPLRAESDDVVSVLEFLGANQLLKLAGANNSAAMAAQWARGRQGGWRWLLHNYLFFRVPLVRPDAFLGWLERRVTFLFSGAFWRVTMVAAVVGLLLVARQWEEFRSTAAALATLEGVLGFLAVLVGVKIVHELGHGLAAKHYGVPVPTMGVAFLVLTPVAYTDVNAAWNLTARRPRLMISAAGMMAELALAAWATVAWALLPDGYWRSAAFVVAAITWVKSLVINASPIMRFDGYYLLADYLDIPNLHARSFALARWQLREWLFGLGEPPPEYFRRSLARGLIALAFFIWVYRLIVFVGIAVFVYHFFFKALGIVLFAVEIAWFVAVPIVAELKAWLQRRAQIGRSRRARVVGLLALPGIALLVVPWPRRITVSAELAPAQLFHVVAPEAGQIATLAVADAARVRAGEPIVRLLSPQLEYRLATARARERAQEGELAAARVDATLRSRLALTQAALATAQAMRREAEAALARLAPTAPFDGVLRLADCDLRAGVWVARQEQLAVLVGAGWRVTGYVDERVRHLVEAGARAHFYPDGNPHQAIELSIAAIERDATRVLPRQILAQPFGGEIEARMVEGDLVPSRALYRLTGDIAEVPPALGVKMRRGRLVIRGAAESPAVRFGRAALALVWREAGF